MKYAFIVIPADEEPFTFFVGKLEVSEIGSMVIAVVKRMEAEPPGWRLLIRGLEL